MTDETPDRLLVIGLDAAPLDLLRHWVDQGLMPNLGRLLDGASIAPVTHPESFRAELPWTAFLTAADPVDVGYWGTVRFDPRAYSVVEGGALVAEPFFARLGVPVVVLDAPHSVPWPAVPGIQVCAWGAHSPQHPPAAQPAGWHDALVRRFGPHPAGDADSTPGWHQPSYLRWLARALVDGARRRAAAMVWLCENQPDWKFAMVVFSELHSAGHHLWHAVAKHPLGGDPAARALFEEVAAAIDEALGALGAALPSSRVVVLSVHGVVANASDLPASYLVPELVHRLHWGWERLAGSPSTKGANDAVRPTAEVDLGTAIGRLVQPHRGADPQRAPDLADQFRHIFSRIRNRRPSPGAFGPSPPLGEGAVVEDRRIDYLGPVYWQRWWSLQRAFVLPSFSDTHLRLNLIGREDHGQVHLSEYDAELDRWQGEIESLRHSRTGAPLDIAFSRPRQADPLANGGPPPDLVATFGEVFDRAFHPEVGMLGPLPYLRTGEHGGTGFVAVSDSSIELPPLLGATDLGVLLGGLCPTGSDLNGVRPLS